MTILPHHIFHSSLRAEFSFRRFYRYEEKEWWKCTEINVLCKRVDYRFFQCEFITNVRINVRLILKTNTVWLLYARNSLRNSTQCANIIRSTNQNKVFNSPVLFFLHVFLLFLLNFIRIFPLPFRSFLALTTYFGSMLRLQASTFCNFPCILGLIKHNASKAASVRWA